MFNVQCSKLVGRGWLGEEFFDLLFVLFDEDVAFEFQCGGELAGLDGPFVVHQQEAFHLFGVAETLVEIIHNPFVFVFDFGMLNHLLIRGIINSLVNKEIEIYLFIIKT